MRRGLEVRVIVRGSQRATPEQRLLLGQLAEDMAACAATLDLVGYYRLDSEFDGIIDKAADNRFLTDAMKPVHALVRRFWYTQRGTEGQQEALVQHARIVRAAANGDAPLARGLLNELYDLNEKYILRLLSSA
ncbi:MAG: FCD domain-containing protein [Rhodobacteraceae bacterium]|nr:FCD domain-containing protein [Paracoccaceae bacterium]